MKKLLPIGTRVRATRDLIITLLDNPHIKMGAMGTISAHTIDAQFGWYPVLFDGKNSSVLMDMNSKNLEVIN